MADTTIGYAVLQIIPSLKGVTEAIEKQIAGQSITVTVEPKWPDKGSAEDKKLDKSIKDAVKKKPVEVPIEPKVDAKKIDAAVKDSVKKSKPPEIKIAPKIDDGPIRKRTKDVAADIQEQLGTAIGKEIGKRIGEGIHDSPVGEWLNDVADKVRGGVERIQSVTDHLKTDTERVRDAVGALRKGDAAGGLQGIADALKDIDNQGAGTGSAAQSIGQLAAKASELQGTYTALKEIGTGLLDVAKGVPGFEAAATRIGAAASAMAGPLAAVVGLFLGWKAVADELSNHAQINPFGAGTGDPAKGFQSPVIGPSIIQTPAENMPLPGQPQVAAVPGGAPPGTVYTQSQGSLDPFAGLLPAGALVPTNLTPQNLPRSGVVPDLRGFMGPDLPGRAGGGLADVLNGLIRGPGTGTSDSIMGWPAGVRVSNGEFITNEKDTAANLPLLQAVNSGVPLWNWIKQLPRFDTGGLVPGSEQLRKIISERFGITNIGGYRPADKYGEHSTGRALDVMTGNDKAKGDAVKDFALANAPAIDLKWVIWRQHLYYPGGGGYDMPDRGTPTQNHMDHVHIFSGPGITNGLLGALQGAANPSSPASAPAGPGDDSGLTGALTGAGQAAAGGGAPAIGGAGGSAGGFSLPTSFGDLGSFGLNNLGKGVGATKSGTDLSVFGQAAGAAVSGQVSSALGAFGVPGAPHWLGGISKLVSGISIGGSGGGGGGVTPASMAIPAAAGPAPLPTDIHGAGAGQPAGPQTVFNIQTARVEDAFVRAQQREREQLATKTDRWSGP